MTVKTWLIFRTYAAFVAAMEAVAWMRGAHTWQVYGLVAAAAILGPLLTALDPWDKSFGLVWDQLVVKVLQLAGMSAMLPLLEQLKPNAQTSTPTAAPQAQPTAAAVTVPVASAPAADAGVQL